MKKFALVGAAAMLAALAGCGGDDGGTLTDREYVRSLEDICTEVNEDINDLEGPEDDTDYRGWETVAEDARDIVSDGLDELNELSPPEDLQRDHDDYVASVERTLDATDDLQAAAEDEDEDDLAEAVETLQEENDERSAIAEDIGADECVEDSGSEPTPETDPPGTDPTITVPPIEMTMPPETAPPVSGTSIETFDFNELVTPPGYTWENIDSDSLASIQEQFDAQFMGQILAIGGANVDDPTNAEQFTVFAFFWNEDDIVASGTGVEFLNGFTETAESSSDTVTDAGFPVTTWTDSDGAEGVGVIDSNISIIMYGGSGSTPAMLTFFDAFILSQS